MLYVKQSLFLTAGTSLIMCLSYLFTSTVGLVSDFMTRFLRVTFSLTGKHVNQVKRREEDSLEDKERNESWAYTRPSVASKRTRTQGTASNKESDRVNLLNTTEQKRSELAEGIQRYYERIQRALKQLLNDSWSNIMIKTMNSLFQLWQCFFFSLQNRDSFYLSVSFHLSFSIYERHYGNYWSILKEISRGLFLGPNNGNYERNSFSSLLHSKGHLVWQLWHWTKWIYNYHIFTFFNWFTNLLRTNNSKTGIWCISVSSPLHKLFHNSVT